MEKKAEMVSSFDAMSVARHFERCMRTIDGERGVWWNGPEGEWWVWFQETGRWRVVRDEAMDLELWRRLEGVAMESKDGGLTWFGPKKGSVTDVAWAMKAVCEASWNRTPTWIRNGEGWNPETCVAFEDVVVSVGEGQFRTRVRDATWVDRVVVPATWREGAECPRWMRCLEEWGNGDPGWGELLRTAMGYAMMGKRRYAKWLLMVGRTRMGKGVVAHVMKRLVGREAWFDTSMDDLGESFGLDGAEGARVLSIAEYDAGSSAIRGRVARVFKNILGEDGMVVNAKYRRQKRGVRILAMPVVQANMIPRLPNEGEGISSKMVVLPFTVSFAERPQHGLREELDGEIGGIAAWAMEGARRLEASGGKGWDEPGSSEDRRRRFRLVNNPMDGFLEARFVENPEGFVRGDLVWSEWLDWKQASGWKGDLARSEVLRRLEEESTWKVERKRRREGEEQRWGLGGVSLKRKVEED